MGMLLALLNKLNHADREIRHKIWSREQNRGTELKGKKIGIIGFGNNGSAFAKKMQGWGVQVLTYDKYKSGYAIEFDWIQEVSLDTLKAEADIISLHIPLTEETFHLIDSAFLEACKNGVILINCARGKNVSLKDLLAALDSSKVAGACLDVFENEKVSTFTEEENAMYENLYSHRSLILSPHIAGWTVESFQGISDVLADKLKAIFLEKNRIYDQKDYATSNFRMPDLCPQCANFYSRKSHRWRNRGADIVWYNSFVQK